MLLHHGATVEVGHYTAIVRVGGQCFTCDDLTVTPSTSHQLSDAGRSVYICLYEKTGLWFLYYLYPLRTHVFLFAVTAHLYPFFFVWTTVLQHGKSSPESRKECIKQVWPIRNLLRFSYSCCFFIDRIRLPPLLRRVAKNMPQCSVGRCTVNHSHQHAQMCLSW